MRSTLVLLAIGLLILSCRKNDSDHYISLQCTDSQTFDSAATANKLTGSWKLVQQRWGGTGEIVTANKDVQVTFNSDSTFTVWENSSVTTQGSWKLMKFSDNTWQLDLSSQSNYLYGFISFCNDNVLFTNSWVDGNDNLFKSID